VPGSAMGIGIEILWLWSCEKQFYDDFPALPMAKVDRGFY